MEPKTLLLSFLLLSSVVRLSFSADLAEQCGTVLTKVVNCLDYSTGKSATPTPACCTSTQEIRKDNPACLCFVIQQAYDGVGSFKSMGVKVDRLLKLPSDCKLTNASTSDCPKLLNLSPSSPDYAIFNSTAASAKTNSSDETSSPRASNGSMPGDIGVLLIVMFAVFLSMFFIRP